MADAEFQHHVEFSGQTVLSGADDGDLLDSTGFVEFSVSAEDDEFDATLFARAKQFEGDLKEGYSILYKFKSIEAVRRFALMVNQWAQLADHIAANPPPSAQLPPPSPGATHSGE